MSCKVSPSLLCKNILWSLEILSSTSIFPIWSSRHFCTTTHLNISLKILPSIWGCQWMHIIHFYAKTHECSLQNLSKTSSFALSTRLAFSTATPFCIVVLHMILFPTYSPPYQALKSRRVAPWEYSWSIK